MEILDEFWLGLLLESLWSRQVKKSQKENEEIREENLEDCCGSHRADSKG